MDTLDKSVEALRKFLARHPRLVVLSGAGVSVASGIPAYRDQDGVWRNSAPITHQQYVDDPARRGRYWARSMLGWPAVRDARPNEAHRALARLEQSGHIALLVTQNVDRLHQRAGSAAVLDLHGRVDRVRCMTCAKAACREQVQQQLLRDNPHHPLQPGERRPDGDSDVADDLVERISAPLCTDCGGVLIPDVVLFGANVPRERVDTCKAAVADADALLVVGSSLQVFSGFRFCRFAAELGRPLAIINPGTTRADGMAALKLPVPCQPLLAALATGTTAASDPSG